MRCLLLLFYWLVCSAGLRNCHTVRSWTLDVKEFLTLWEFHWSSCLVTVLKPVWWYNARPILFFFFFGQNQRFCQNGDTMAVFHLRWPKIIQCVATGSFLCILSSLNCVVWLKGPVGWIYSFCTCKTFKYCPEVQIKVCTHHTKMVFIPLQQFLNVYIFIHKSRVFFLVSFYLALPYF